MWLWWHLQLDNFRSGREFHRGRYRLETPALAVHLTRGARLEGAGTQAGAGRTSWRRWRDGSKYAQKDSKPQEHVVYGEQRQTIAQCLLRTIPCYHTMENEQDGSTYTLKIPKENSIFWAILIFFLSICSRNPLLTEFWNILSPVPLGRRIH